MSKHNVSIMNYIDKLGQCKELREVIETLQKNKTLNDSVVNNALKPFADMSMDKQFNNITPNTIEIGLINAFYVGVGVMLGLTKVE